MQHIDRRCENTVTSVTNRSGSTSDLRRFISRSGMPCQLNCKFHSKPPTFVAFAEPNLYCMVLSSTTSITGATTFDSFSAILSNKGSNQPTACTVHCAAVRPSVTCSVKQSVNQSISQSVSQSVSWCLAPLSAQKATSCHAKSKSLLKI